MLVGSDYQVQIDASDLEAKLKKLEGIRDGAPRATMRAFNKTVTGMKTDAAKEISQRYTAKQKYIKKELKTRNATMSDLSAELRSQGRPMRSIKFQHRANTNPGLKSGRAAFLRAVKSGSGGRLIGKPSYSKAFIATMPNGTKGIFQRTGTAVDSRKARSRNGQRGSLSKNGRENIEQVYSPGVVQTLNNKEVREAISQKATERFNKAIDHEIDYLLRK